MLESFPFLVLIGTVLGFLSGIGIGGGSLLMLWLTVVVDMPHNAARGINLLFFLPSAVTACLFRWKQGTLDWKMVLPAIAGGCLSAAIFSRIGIMVNTNLLKKLFGGLLLLTGLRELFYRQKNTEAT